MKEGVQRIRDLVIIPANQEGDIQRIDDSTIYLKQGRKLVEMAENARRSLLALARFEKLSRMSAPASMLSDSKKRVKKESQGVNPTLLRALKKDRLNLWYVLNCYGGSNQDTETHDFVREYVQTKGGRVNVLGGRNIDSNAALLFMEADERHVIRQAKFTLHLGTLEAHPDSIYQIPDVEGIDPDVFVEGAAKERERMINWFRKGFLSKIPKKYAGYQRIVDWINSIPPDLPQRSDDYQDYPFTMSGEELVEAGLARMIEGDPVEELMKLMNLKGNALRMMPDRLWDYLASLEDEADNTH